MLDQSKPLKFEAKYLNDGGRRILVVKPYIETLQTPDGKRHVKVHAPSLAVMSKFAKELDQQAELQRG